MSHLLIRKFTPELMLGVAEFMAQTGHTDQSVVIAGLKDIWTKGKGTLLPPELQIPLHTEHMITEEDVNLAEESFIIDGVKYTHKSPEIYSITLCEEGYETEEPGEIYSIEVTDEDIVEEYESADVIDTDDVNN